MRVFNALSTEACEQTEVVKREGGQEPNRWLSNELPVKLHQQNEGMPSFEFAAVGAVS